MGSTAMTYIQSFIKTGSDIQKLIGGGGETQRHKCTYNMVIAKENLYFFKIIKEY
jgi:hypothetical protein